jgi:hypothetical protein
MPSADPRPRRMVQSTDTSVDTSPFLVPCTRIRSGAFQAGHLMRIVPMFASLVVDTRRSFSLAAQSRRTYNGICHFSSRDRSVQHNHHHPCWKAAHFLPCTRPPDVMRLHRPQRGRINPGPSKPRAFVSTRSGLQTMTTGGHEDATAPAAVTSAAAGPVRRFMPIAPPHDMWPSAI